MDFSIIIPIYNEEAILEKETNDLIRELRIEFPHAEYELFLVENGSADRTLTLARELTRTYPCVRILQLPAANYGEALKQGILQSQGTCVVLFNIDHWDCQFLQKGLHRIHEKGIDGIVGSKLIAGALDTRPLKRRLITTIFNFLLQKIFRYRGTDTHGMKVLAREKIIPIVKECRVQREMFDTELVLRAERHGLRFEEVPVVCYEKRKSTLSVLRRVPRALKDLCMLYFALRKISHRSHIRL